MTSTAAPAQNRESGPDLAPEMISGADTIHIAVISVLGREVAEEFATTPTGYRAAIAFLSRHGRLEQVGVEGTSSYGAGLATALAWPRPAWRSWRSTDLTAPSAAGEASPTLWTPTNPARRCCPGSPPVPPKDPNTEAIPSLHNARRSAIKARTATMKQIIAMLVTAPDAIRTNTLC